MPRVVYDRAEVMARVCAELERGKSLTVICESNPDLPHASTILTWVERDPEGIGQQYARARQTGYELLADEIVELSQRTHTYTLVPELDPDGNQLYDEAGKPRSRQVLVPLNSDVMASIRLQIDTKKWLLSKMLPKVYGDKVQQEHVGKDGGPIQLAAVDMRKLTDDDINQMEQLMLKAQGEDSAV